MSLPPYSIRHSPIHGLGLMACRMILKGEMIPGPNIIGCPGYNHSCDPNLGERVGEVGSPRPALRNIRPDEELTIAYSKLNGHTVFCGCKACGGKAVECNCPIHRKTATFMAPFILGAGLMISGFLSQLEELWVEKLDLPPFWKKR